MEWNGIKDTEPGPIMKPWPLLDQPLFIDGHFNYNISGSSIKTTMSAKAPDRVKTSETAERYIKAGKIAEAVAEYQKLLDGTGQDIPIGNIIGDLCLQLGQEEKALSLFISNVGALEKRGAYSQALAIAKKIYKIRPSVVENIIRIGDLYGQLGFSSEAKTEYARAAEELEKRKETGPLIALFEKRVRIDRSDLSSRLKLAGLYLKESQGDRALVELNDAADLLFVRNENVEAEKILLEALAIQDGNIRTITNLVRVYRALARNESATRLLEQTIEKHGRRPDFLALLANLYWEGGDNDRAAEVLGRILVDNPGNDDVRAKLGQVESRRGRFDRALEIIDPLISFFLKRGDDDKAVGLLGMILMTGVMHLPTLERLAGVFRSTVRLSDLEITLRVLNEEYRANRRNDDRLRILHELFPLSPLDSDLAREIEALGAKAERPQPVFDKGMGTAAAENDADREIIRMNLAKSDLYIGQGLIRNARRILENLLLLYPDDPRVKNKFEDLRQAAPGVEDEEIPEIVEQIGRKEAKIIGAVKKPSVSGSPSPQKTRISDSSVPKQPAASPQKPIAEKKTPTPAQRTVSKPPVQDKDLTVTIDEIFSGLGLASKMFSPAAEPGSHLKYFDIEEKIEEEIEAIEAEFYKQLKEKASVIEKDLVEIVQEFRRQVDAKLDQKNYEARYNLGLAFMEQGLFDEAIADFELAAADPERAADCWGLIGGCYVQKRSYQEARRSLEKAISLTALESPARFALAYDLASLYETLDENDAALAFYREVQGWNPKYRNTSKRIKILEKIVS